MKTRRVFFVLLLLLSVLLAGTVYASFSLYKGTLQEENRAELESSAQHVSSELSLRLSGLERTVELWAQNPAITDHGSLSQRQALETFRNRTAFAGASVIAANGTMTSIVAGISEQRRRLLVGRDFSNRTYFQRAMQGETYISEPLEAESGNYIVTVSTPIRRNGRIVGTLNGAFHLSNGSFFSTFVATLEPTQRLRIQTESGRLLYQSRPMPADNPLVRNATVQEVGWTVSVAQSRRAIRSSVREVTYLQVGGLLVIFCSVIGFGWWVYRNNLRQVERLLSGFEALESQEYGTEVEVGGSEEWEQIGEGFNTMSRALEDYVSELEDREQTLREFKRAVEHAGHAVYIMDRDWTIQYVNPAFEEITGYSESDVLGKTPDILEAEKRNAEELDDLRETAAAGEVWAGELVNARRDGELYVARETVAPLTDGDGEVERFVAIQTDITGLKDRERQLQTIDRVLRHNLRNRVGVITSYAELIRDAGDVGTAENAQYIVESGERLLELADKERRIVQLLTEDSTAYELNVSSLLDAVAERLHEECPGSVVAVSAPDDLTVKAVPEIKDAVYELAENGLIHDDSDTPRVEISARREADEVAITVTDYGEQLPEDDRRILTGESEVEQLSHGTGVGLWLVYHTVKQSNGRIRIDENTGRETVITLVLPRA